MPINPSATISKQPIRREVLIQVVASFRRRAARTRPDGPVDTEGKLALSVAATVYESVADELETGVLGLRAGTIEALPPIRTEDLPRG